MLKAPHNQEYFIPWGKLIHQTRPRKGTILQPNACAAQLAICRETVLAS